MRIIKSKKLSPWNSKAWQERFYKEQQVDDSFRRSKHKLETCVEIYRVRWMEDPECMFNQLDYQGALTRLEKFMVSYNVRSSTQVMQSAAGWRGPRRWLRHPGHLLHCFFLLAVCLCVTGAPSGQVEALAFDTQAQW
jgi:hypothetical protein